MAVADHDFAEWVSETLQRRGRAVIRSRGWSMHPAIPDGAAVEVRPVAFDELLVGDVVVYHRDGECFCHRLIRKAGRYLILKGDTLLRADPPVSYDQVIGRVTILINAEMRFIPLDDPLIRRRAAFRARLSYFYALLYHLRYYLVFASRSMRW